MADAGNSQESRDTRSDAWAEEEALGDAAPAPSSYLPIWLSAPAWAAVAVLPGVIEFPIPGSPWPAVVAVAAVAFGVWLRRQGSPSLLRFWLAVIAALSGFVIGLLVTINADSLLTTVWASGAASLFAYTLVMALRPDLRFR